MKRFKVEVTDTALAAIAAQARYIVESSGSNVEAQRWLERIWDAVDSLERWPRRAGLAEEDEYVEYEVRQLVIDNHLLLFTIVDERSVIRIVGLRHGHRRPRRDELPSSSKNPTKRRPPKR